MTRRSQSVEIGNRPHLCLIEFRCGGRRGAACGRYLGALFWVFQPPGTPARYCLGFEPDTRLTSSEALPDGTRRVIVFRWLINVPHTGAVQMVCQRHGQTVATAEELLTWGLDARRTGLMTTRLIESRRNWPPLSPVW